MKDFGVIELASAKTKSAPGWAYVPDNRPSIPGAGGNQNKKRSRNPPGGALSMNDLTARQETRIRKELDVLDKDGGRDSSIPIPIKTSRPQVKHTANVRKILTSQKNFANHLDDFLALQALEANNAAAAAASKRAATAKKDGPTPVPVEKTYDLLVEPFLPQPVAHPGDKEALLRSRVPPLPTDAELRALLAQPALTYGEAKGRYDEYGEGSYPRRVFCEVCGYWGRVRCMKCGTRVCALQCLDLHREECVTRYGL
ncbi:Putative Hit finger domain protein [[Torrubiella] hemipterigena]|uniref:Putative Hit finger domain protein n=1 Tax=[Torrubiella] hemipterigena TaxID=1531966 RepID=A0A0A1T8M2_9HYPO|nr:Putative Hit finger domain protein [[Torrubiella] hemipterigena]